MSIQIVKYVKYCLLINTYKLDNDAKL